MVLTDRNITYTTRTGLSRLVSPKKKLIPYARIRGNNLSKAVVCCGVASCDDIWHVLDVDTSRILVLCARIWRVHGHRGLEDCMPACLQKCIDAIHEVGPVTNYAQLSYLNGSFCNRSPPLTPRISWGRNEYIFLSTFRFQHPSLDLTSSTPRLILHLSDQGDRIHIVTIRENPGSSSRKVSNAVSRSRTVRSTGIRDLSLFLTSLQGITLPAKATIKHSV